jgi:hypothetical protein
MILIYLFLVILVQTEYRQSSACCVLVPRFRTFSCLSESSHLHTRFILFFVTPIWIRSSPFFGIKLILSFIHSILCYFNISESSHLFRNILFLFRIPSFLWYFDISESSHLFRNILFSILNAFFSMIFRHKWILSLISKYSLSCSEYLLFYDISI